MATNEDKITKFHLAINHYAEEQRLKIEEEISSFKQKELSEAETEVLNEAYHLIQTEMAQMRNGISRETAQREMAGRRALLNKRLEISNKVFEQAADSLREFTKTDRYEKWLCSRVERVSSIFTAADVVLQVRAQDLPLREKLQKAFGGPCSLEQDDSISIGGLRARSTVRGIMADETLDSLLENQRGWFEENSGLAVV